jgi:hypothetical protein
MSTLWNNAKAVPATTVGRWMIAVVVALAVIWILGMAGVIHLALPLVWILPFTCIALVALAILWEGGLFDD